jgi:hypothetical protein
VAYRNDRHCRDPHTKDRRVKKTSKLQNYKIVVASDKKNSSFRCPLSSCGCRHLTFLLLLIWRVTVDFVTLYCKNINIRDEMTVPKMTSGFPSMFHNNASDSTRFINQVCLVCALIRDWTVPRNIWKC